MRCWPSSSSSVVMGRGDVSLLLLLLSLSFTATPIFGQNCNYVTLVKCFINILDEWTWTLYELKENVVTINEDQCQHLKQLDKCIEDDGPEPHECNHNEIIAASNTVSDLLVHRKNSGSFLKSYYLLTYACSSEGQELLNEHRSCLSRERIGEMTLSAGTYLSEKFMDLPEEEVCPEVNAKLQEYMEAMSGLCDEGAAQIMCRSLTNMFKGLHADKLNNCVFSCLRPVHGESSPNHPQTQNHHVHNDHQSNEDGSVVPGQTAPSESGSNGGGGIGAMLPSLLLLLIGSMLVAVQ